MPEQLDFAKFSRAEVEEVFGNKSDSRKAAHLAKHDPARYHALKQAAVYTYGLVSEAMLPRQHRFTREQLDAKARADVAAQRDETFPLPEPVSSRLGLPPETRVSWSTLQKLMGREHD
jgi:hypothetical protein